MKWKRSKKAQQEARGKESNGESGGEVLKKSSARHQQEKDFGEGSGSGKDHSSAVPSSKLSNSGTSSLPNGNNSSLLHSNNNNNVSSGTNKAPPHYEYGSSSSDQHHPLHLLAKSKDSSSFSYNSSRRSESPPDLTSYETSSVPVTPNNRNHHHHHNPHTHLSHPSDTAHSRVSHELVKGTASAAFLHLHHQSIV